MQLRAFPRIGRLTSVVVAVLQPHWHLMHLGKCDSQIIVLEKPEHSVLKMETCSVVQLTPQRCTLRPLSCSSPCMHKNLCRVGVLIAVVSTRDWKVGVEVVSMRWLAQGRKDMSLALADISVYVFPRPYVNNKSQATRADYRG
ncbi:hypothetical protein T440DRAFT_469953 [Plenodomus tracheiphilus IPT5]|uniref:Uncharacterized protein n=1 Tax=Plenodomus tracheiphilus IPT5 TaxID=1408161 RepID=A0A6A7B3F2_9PLEO|nr:hypothetical protein T440DRAFT_469953 [Plenodomus tracheiphilus IPT5]